MAEKKNVLVVCVDRDDDLGRKAGVVGPIIGRTANINAAAKLALADPGDSDVNALFAAVKKFDEIKGKVPNSEVVTLTGKGKKIGFETDQRINEQLDAVMDKFPADGIILVTDGAEDDQVIPILQSRAPIISKQLLIIKQAKEVESLYYSIKETLKDPSVGSIVFGIPGLVLIGYALLFYLGAEKQFFQIISFILGIYLILKGTGLEEKIARTTHRFVSSISLQRTSFPFYIAVIFILGFGLLSAYNSFIFSQAQELLVKVVESLAAIVMFSALSAISFLIGKGIDAIHLKKAFKLRHYIMSAVFVLLIWLIIDSGKKVVVGETDLNFFLTSIISSFVLAFIAYKATSVLDIRKKITKLLLGLPVYSKEGRWLGKVEYVLGGKDAIEYKDNQTKKLVRLKKNQFLFSEGRILITA